MEIEIKYSFDFEVQRVLNTLKDIEWFRKNNYKIVLPANVSLKNKETTTEEYVRKNIAKEFKKEDYEGIILKIRNEWSNVDERLSKSLLEMSLNPQKIYFVFLTKYGVGGSYRCPNNIVINIGISKDKNIIKTIIHELIHLSIEPFIVKFKIGHWQKERLVDLILSKIFPELAMMQKLPEEDKIQKIDKIFSRFFPNIEKIISNVKLSVPKI